MCAGKTDNIYSMILKMLFEIVQNDFEQHFAATLAVKSKNKGYFVVDMHKNSMIIHENRLNR